MADRQRLLHRKILVDGQDLAVEEDGVGGLGRGRTYSQGEIQRRENGNSFADSTCRRSRIFICPKPSLRGALATKQSIPVLLRHGLLRFARNDGENVPGRS